MGQLIAVIGNVGVGKTTFTRQLCAAGTYVAALEDHAGRAFHTGFARDHVHAALANQIDFLLMRAEQERTIRRSSTIGVQDGGLDQDFCLFTRFFVRRGYLQPEEFALCQRLYTLLRSMLPPPDLYIHLVAPQDVLIERYRRRKRAAEVIAAADIPLLDVLMAQWIAEINAPIITVDMALDDPGCERALQGALPQIEWALARTGVGVPQP